ncbi:fumarate reductase/succinate dehydrogenase flavoprotein domain-containing protein [Klebsiella pneumoniae]|nr:fumarate reductase/succinate dehydrogenase flavoprotein domain-containing protein [Klebsiella pneumoniae]
MKSWDVIVIGSGAAGFAAAVTACCKGLSVLMLEKAGQFGGTSAISGGAVWLHDTDQARAEGKSGSAEAMKNLPANHYRRGPVPRRSCRSVCQRRAGGAGLSRA